MKIVETEDGSRTLYLPTLDEHYHSIHGAKSESEHIFIRHALEARLSSPHPESLRLLEIGFGTGLNALLTFLHQQRSDTPYHLTYTTFELNPLPLSVITQLFADRITPSEWDILQKFYTAPWDEEVTLADGFTLHKLHADATSTPLPTANDIIYMDAFAPEKTPPLWTEQFLAKLYHAAAPQARMSTFCVKGEVRRTLQRLGFTCERVPGPPGGKPQILTCIKD